MKVWIAMCDGMVMGVFNSEQKAIDFVNGFENADEYDIYDYIMQ